MVDYSVQVQWHADTVDAEIETSSPDWVIAAESDAATTRVTALRRFLWRYGRDLVNPRAHFRTLVELYLALREPGTSWVDAAARVFESLPEPGDGDILKKDILGVGSSSPSLIPPLPPSELLQLLSSQRIQDLVNQDQMRKRFELIPPEQVAHLANFVVHHREELGPWEEAINAGLVASATHRSVADDLPGGIRKLILLSRPDLISKAAVAIVPNDDLIELAYAHQGHPAAEVLANAIVRRDVGQWTAKVFMSMPLQVFAAATAAAIEDELNPAWAQLVAENSALIFDSAWPDGVKSTRELAVGLRLMRFPRNSGKSAEEWAAALDSMKDDVSGDDRVRLQGFLLREALRDKTPTSWRLITIVLPELRPIIRANELPEDVYQTLVNDLPKFSTAAYWDLDKRILLSLSQLQRLTPNESALRALSLSDEDEVTVSRGAHDEEARSKSRFWWF